MNTSDTWIMLGIDPTKDEERIREAYLKALPAYHPEDDPAGFMKLRAAYETALAIAAGKDDLSGENGTEQSNTGQEKNDGSGDVIQKEIHALLSDFPRRMSQREWETIIEANGGNSIDGQEVFSQKLLVELMDGYYLPRRLWQFFDKTFTWSARARQLKEMFPPKYVEYVLNGMRYERALRDRFFDFEKDAGEDFDAFVGAYHSLAEALRVGELEKATELEAANRGGIFAHPDYRLLLARLRRMREEHEEARAILDELNATWPDDPDILSAMALSLLDEDPKEALSLYLRIMEIEPDHYTARVGAARARLKNGLFEDAKADAYKLLMQDPFDGAAISVFGEANVALVSVFQARLDNDPEDMEARYKLASCLCNLGKYTESLDLIADTEPDEEHKAKHYELYADLFVSINDELTDEDKVVLLEYVEAWEAAEKDRQRLRFLPEKYRRLGMDDIALDKADILLSEFPADSEICRVRAQIFRDRGDEHNAFAALSAGLEKSPSHAGLLDIEAHLLEQSGNLGAAVDSAEASLEYFPYNWELLELLGRIYDRVDMYEEVLTVVRRAEDIGLLKGTLPLLKAVALSETGDPEGKAQSLFEEILESDPDNAICMEKLGMIYAKSGRVQEAMSLIGRYVEKYESPYAYLLRGWIYANYLQISDGFGKARARSDFRKAIEMEERYAPAWYQLGILAYEEDRMAEAVADFQLTLDIDPEFSGAHLYLSFAYDETGDAESALSVLDKGTALEKERDEKLYLRLLTKKADILFEQHRYEEYAKCVNTGDEIVQLEGDAVDGALRLAQLAFAYYEAGEDERAEALFERAFSALAEAKAPEDEKAAVLYRMNDWIAHYQRYAMRDPVASLACYVEFEWYTRYLRYEPRDAVALLDFYVRTYGQPNTLQERISLAKAYDAAGRTKEAQRFYKKALKSRGEQDDACRDCRIGEACFGLGQYKKAKDLLLKAVQRASDFSGCPQRRCFEALFILALIALNDGDREGARKYYRLVMDTVQDRDYRDAAPLFE